MIAAFFSPYAPATLTAHASVFSHNFKRFERFTKPATNLICITNLFLKVGDDVLLVPIDPAGEHSAQDLDHGIGHPNCLSMMSS